MIGLITIIINHLEKGCKRKNKKIFMLEYPKTLSVNKSLLFLTFIINHILEIKTIKGKIFTSNVGK